LQLHKRFDCGRRRRRCDCEGAHRKAHFPRLCLCDHLLIGSAPKVGIDRDFCSENKSGGKQRKNTVVSVDDSGTCVTLPPLSTTCQENASPACVPMLKNGLLSELGFAKSTDAGWKRSVMLASHQSKGEASTRCHVPGVPSSCAKALRLNDACALARSCAAKGDVVCAVADCTMEPYT
jgi:hypothetical protein